MCIYIYIYILYVLFIINKIWFTLHVNAALASHFFFFEFHFILLFNTEKRWLIVNAYVCTRYFILHIMCFNFRYNYLAWHLVMTKCTSTCIYISIRQGKGLKFLFDIPSFKLICQCVLRKKLLTFGKFWILHYKPRSLIKRYNRGFLNMCG